MVRLRKELQMQEVVKAVIVEWNSKDPKMDLHAKDDEFYHWRKKVGWI